MRSLWPVVAVSLVGCVHAQREERHEEPPPLTSMQPRPAPPRPEPQPEPPPPPAPVSAPAPVVEVPAGEDVPDAPTVGRPARSEMTPVAPPVCALPPLPAGATRWIGRSLSTGTMPGPSFLDTFIVDVRGANATWSEFSMRASKPGPPGPTLPPGEWACAEAAVMESRVERQSARELVLGFSVNDERYTMRCEKKTLQVAPAEALREPLPQRDESCKRSRWATAARQPVEALVCVTSGVGSVAILAKAPGVEFVAMDEDDCGDPTLALRRLEPGGAVRTVRRLPAKR